MRPQLGWADLPGRSVGVWGLGVEGRASVARLRALGVDPVVVDDRPTDAGVLATDAGGLDALRRCEVVIRTPGMSRYRPDVEALAASGVTLVGGLGLWLFDAPRDRVVCITGTKGKSTTTSIVGHLATGLGLRCVTGGNLGTPPFAPDAPTDADLWVIEVSSYQATDLAVTPPVVAVTSLHPDHLDWHGSVERYYDDKLSMTSQPGARVCVAAGEDERIRARADRLGPTVRWVRAADADGWSEPLGLPGRHNAVNAAIARAVLVEVGVPGADDDAVVGAACADFAGLPSRLRRVHTAGAVEFFDDSLATNVLPTVAALDAFPGRPVALIVGGHDRGIDYAPLARHLAVRAASTPTFVLTLPTSGDRIAETVAAQDDGPPTVRCVDLDEAVRVAAAWARERGGVVLLSPAAPSFGQFADYRDRSRAFLEAAVRFG